MAIETAPANTVHVPASISSLLMRAADSLFALIPQSRPSPASVHRCQLIGHRGAKDVLGIKENSFAAFDYALNHGMNGIEIDVRWTADQQLVVAHDPDLLRVHGLEQQIHQLSLAELQTLCPDVPSLKSVIERYVGKLSFYIELKKDDWTQLAQQQQRLAEVLAPLTPGKDYYLMSFDLALLEKLDHFASATKVAIMHSNPSAIRDLISRQSVGIVGGHYLLLTRKFRQLCQQHNVQIGVGFPASRNSLWRELNRGAVFAFIDDPKAAAAWL